MNSDDEEANARESLDYAGPRASWEPTWWTVVLILACLFGIGIICAIVYDRFRN